MSARSDTKPSALELEAPTVPKNPLPNNRQRSFRRLLLLLPLLATLFALHLLRAQLEQHSLSEIGASVRATPFAALLFACVVALAAYVVLTGYDWIGLRYLRSDISYRRSAPISLISYGVGNALGFPLFTSTPLRFRLFKAAGLTGAQVIQVISFTMASFWLGLLALGGSLLLLEPTRLAEMSGYSRGGLRLLGLMLISVVAAYLVATARARGPLRFRRWQLQLPTLKVAIAQVGIAALDWLLTASVLWVLFPKGAELGFPTFLAAYLLAQTMALLSLVPGGIGVFEATLVVLLSQWAPADSAVGALLLFRFIYYLLPLAGSLTLLVVLERRAVSRALVGIEEKAAPWLGPIVPRALAIATFGAGGFLLVSGSLPAIDGRLSKLAALVPLGLIESSHLVATIAGFTLLVLARGLARRLDGAWHAALWILTVGIVAAVLRGFDWEEATVLGFVLLLLLFSKRHFYRKASLLSRPFSPRWLLAVGIVVAGGVWIGLVAHGDARFSDEQLWQFSLRSDIPRFLRAQVVIAAGLVVLGTARLFRGAPPAPQVCSPEELETVRAIVSRDRSAAAALALLGDKRFLFSDDRSSFIMYGVSGDSWIAMNDPVGDPSQFGELIWRFRELCDIYDERPVFYQIRPDHLPLYLEAGLSVIKLGESARTPLSGFNLEGSRRKDFRQSLRKAERDNLSFEIAPREAVPALMDDLQRISDEWLVDKGASEKSFSLGNFSEPYLLNFPIALVRQEGTIIAFANVLASVNKHELSVDLMRYANGAPHGVMDYLFVQLMLWGSAQGYGFFHLGMAPLAGLEQHALAPTWDRFGAWLFRHGEHFYNFKGLRSYKEKFDPVWEPRYLAAPDGLATGRALLDVAVLIAGGLPALIRR